MIPYKTISYIIFFTFFLGCGVMSSPTEETLTLPQKISVAIPKVLEKKTQNKEKILVDDIKINNSSYYDIQGYIQIYEKILDEIKSDLLLANQVMKDITNICKDRAFNESCIIPKESLTLTINEKVLNQLRLLVPENFNYGSVDFLLNKKLFFGRIEFIKYDDDKAYQYQLTMDMSNINGTIGFYDQNKPPKIIQSTRWSKDKKNIFSSITKEDKFKHNEPWTLHYQQLNNKEIMHINNKQIHEDSLKNNILTLEKKISGKSTIQFHQIRKNINSALLFLVQDSSYIEINGTKGLQKTIKKETIDKTELITYKEEILDENGTLLGISYCKNNTPECQINNSDTWFTNNLDETIFEPFKSIEFEILKIKGGVLQEGEYWLLPKEYNIEKLTIKEALKYRVAEFIYYQKVSQGVLYNKEYRDKLEELKLIYILYNNDLDKFSSEKNNKLFQIISEEEKPTITIGVKE